MKSKHIENLTRFMFCGRVYKLKEGPYKGSLCLVNAENYEATLIQFEPLDDFSHAWNVAVPSEPTFGTLSQTSGNVWDFFYGLTRRRSTPPPCSTGIEAIIQVCKIVLSGIVHEEGVS